MAKKGTRNYGKQHPRFHPVRLQEGGAVGKAEVDTELLEQGMSNEAGPTAKQAPTSAQVGVSPAAGKAARWQAANDERWQTAKRALAANDERWQAANRALADQALAPAAGPSRRVRF